MDTTPEPSAAVEEVATKLSGKSTTGARKARILRYAF
jgi:hypothetical protein